MPRFNRLELISPVDDALVDAEQHRDCCCTNLGESGDLGVTPEVGDANLTFSYLLAQHREAMARCGLAHDGRLDPVSAVSF